MNVKFSILFVFVFALLVLPGCVPKLQFQFDNTYKGNVQDIQVDNKPIVVRAVAENGFNLDAVKVGWAAPATDGSTCSAGRQWKTQLFDSFSKMGITTVEDNTAIADNTDFTPLLSVAQSNGARYIVIASEWLVSSELNKHTGSNIGKAFVPFGLGGNPTAERQLTLSAHMAVYDTKESKVILDKEYQETDKKEFSYPPDKANREYVQVLINMTSAQESKILNKFWDDFSNAI